MSDGTGRDRYEFRREADGWACWYGSRACCRRTKFGAWAATASTYGNLDLALTLGGAVLAMLLAITAIILRASGH